MISEKEEFLNKCKDPEFVQNIVVQFSKLYYYLSAYGMTWKNTSWMGIPIQKTPTDCFVYQEILYYLRPDYIIETGTKAGGSALFFASICDIIEHGEVITVDVDNEKTENLPKHSRITYLTGSSVDNEIIEFIGKKVENKKVMIILDSDHAKHHVLKELELYSRFIQVNDYLIVEDTNCSGHPVIGMEGEGPLEAVQEFLAIHRNFKVDRECEKFLLTFAPSGFLYRAY